METALGMKELYLYHCDNPNLGSVASTCKLCGSTKSLIDVDISESHDKESSHPPFDTLYDNTSCELESERHISRLYGSIKSLIDVDISDSHDTECSHPPFDTLYDNTSFHVESENVLPDYMGAVRI